MSLAMMILFIVAAPAMVAGFFEGLVLLMRAYVFLVRITSTPKTEEEMKK